MDTASNLTRQFLDRCAAYCARRGISEARLSTIILKDGKRLRRLREGAGVQIQTLERAAALLSELERKAA